MAADRSEKAPALPAAASPAGRARRSLVVCPLEFERRALRRAGLEQFCDLECCGPGTEAVRRWATLVPDASDRLVLLAGVAGGVSERAIGGTAWVASEIIDVATSTRWRTAIEPRFQAAFTAVIVSVDEIVTDSAAKRALAARWGADLVDLESAAFARVAGELGWRWAVIRGVSDGRADRLPARIGKWVNARGRTRPLRVAVGLLLRPWRLPAVIAAARHARRGLAGVAAIIETAARAEAALARVSPS